MKKRLIALICVIIVLTVSLSGCMQFKITYNMENEDIDNVIIDMAYNKTVLDTMDKDSQTEFDSYPEDIMQAMMGGSVPGTKVIEIPLSYKEGEYDFVGRRYEVTSDEAGRINEEINKDMFKTTPLGNNQYRLEMERAFLQEEEIDSPNIDMGLSLESMGMSMEDYLSMYALQGGKMQVSIKTNNKVLSHNADQVVDGEYTWDIMKESLEGSKRILFMVYQVDGTGTDGTETEGTGTDKKATAPKKEDFIAKYKLDTKDPDFYGKALQGVNVLFGTDKGLELDSELLRLQGALIYARLLGVEEEIEEFAKTNPTYDSGFTDVPDWAKKTMNYLHYKKLVFGKGNNLYGSYDPMSEAQFTALVLRALGYSEANKDFVFIDAPQMADELGFYFADISGYSIESNERLTRRDMSYIAYNSLFIQNKDKTEYLMDKLSINK